VNKLTLTRRPERGDSAVMISLLSGRSGVGKSVLALNLAERLATQGHKLLLVDADLLGGNLHVLCNRACDYGLGEFADSELSLPEAVTEIMPGVDLLGGLRNGLSLDPDDPKAARELVRSLLVQSGQYDFILVDHCAGVSQSAIQTAVRSDINLIVLNPEFSSITDGYGLFKLCTKKDRGLDCRLLVNRAEDSAEADYIFRKFVALAERFLGRVPTFMGHLHESHSIKQSIAAQQVLAQIAPECRALLTLDSMAARLAEKLSAETVVSLESASDVDQKSFTIADIRE